MIKEHAPPDGSVWDEWLAYGTALCLERNVEKAIDELKIDRRQIRAPKGIGWTVIRLENAISSGTIPREEDVDGF